MSSSTPQSPAGGSREWTRSCATGLLCQRCKNEYALTERVFACPDCGKGLDIAYDYELARRRHWTTELTVRRSDRVSAWTAGAICGVTYCVAELPNSFVKRRLGISPGERAIKRGHLQYLVDQADSVAGCLIPLRLLYRAKPDELVTAFVLGLTIHIVVDAARA